MRQRSEQYVQHDPTVPDGIDAFQGFMAGPGSGMIYHNVFKTLGQGDF